MGVAIRVAGPDDIPFLREMLFEAFFWRPEQPRPTLDEFAQNPEFQKLARDWGRPGDRAYLAEEQGTFVGAAWYRLWTNEEHSYGFVDKAIPELGIGVRAKNRGRGIGRQLLRALIGQAQADGFARLSLSVEPDNFSRKLYESEGFVKIGENGSAWTMVKSLESTARLYRSI